MQLKRDGQRFTLVPKWNEAEMAKPPLYYSHVQQSSYGPTHVFWTPCFSHSVGDSLAYTTLVESFVLRLIEFISTPRSIENSATRLR